MPVARNRAAARAAGSILCAALLALSPAAQAQSIFSGSVRDPLGNVLAGVEVLVVGASSLPAAIGHSDPRGRFEIADLVPGTYRIAALKRGYATFIGEIDTVVQSSLDVVLRPAGETPLDGADPEWVLRVPRRSVTREVEAGTLLAAGSAASAPAPDLEPALERRVEIAQMFTTGARGAGREDRNGDLRAGETALRFATPLGGRGSVLLEGRSVRAGAHAPSPSADRAEQAEAAMSFGFLYEPSLRDEVEAGLYYGQNDFSLSSPGATLADLEQRHRSLGSQARWMRRVDRDRGFEVGLDARETALDGLDPFGGAPAEYAHHAVEAHGAYRNDAAHSHEVRVTVKSQRLAQPARIESVSLDQPVPGWDLRVAAEDSWTAPGSPVSTIYGIEYREPVSGISPGRIIPRVGGRYNDAGWSLGAVVAYHTATGPDGSADSVVEPASRVGWDADARIPVLPGVHVRLADSFAPAAPEHVVHASGGQSEPVYLTQGEVALRQHSVVVQEERGSTVTYVELARGRAEGALAALLPYGTPSLDMVASRLVYHDGVVGVRIPASGTHLVGIYRQVRNDAHGVADSAEESFEVRLHQAVARDRLPADLKVLFGMRLSSIDSGTLADWERSTGNDAALEAVAQRVSAGLAIAF